MKYIVHLYIFSLLAFNAHSQAWKDSLRIARKAYQEGAFERAYAAYLSTEKIAPKNIDISSEKGQAAYKATKLKESEKIYSKKTQAKSIPSHKKAASYHNLGNTRFKQEKYAEAIEAYKQALRANPNDPETRYNLARAIRKKQEKDKQQQEQQKQDEKNKSNSNQENSKPKENKNQQNSKQNQSPNKPNSSNEENQTQHTKSKLSDKQNEKMLNDLAKQEMQTKRKMNAKRTKSSTNKSGKDW
jgi:tetratricopeptide (TPR) repeat protein